MKPRCKDHSQSDCKLWLTDLLVNWPEDVKPKLRYHSDRQYC